MSFQPLTDDPWPDRTPCLFDGCRLSTEEHHRLNHALTHENRLLKEQVRDDAVDLAAVDSALLLAEITRRLGDA